MRQDVSVSHVNESIIARPAGRMLSYDPQGETEADQNIKALADLINKNKEGNNEPLNYVDLPNTAPPDSGNLCRKLSGFPKQNHINDFACLFYFRDDKHRTT